MARARNEKREKKRGAQKKPASAVRDHPTGDPVILSGTIREFDEARWRAVSKFTQEVLKRERRRQKLLLAALRSVDGNE